MAKSQKLKLEYLYVRDDTAYFMNMENYALYTIPTDRLYNRYHIGDTIELYHYHCIDKDLYFPRSSSTLAKGYTFEKDNYFIDDNDEVCLIKNRPLAPYAMTAAAKNHKSIPDPELIYEILDLKIQEHVTVEISSSLFRHDRHSRDFLVWCDPDVISYSRSLDFELYAKVKTTKEDDKKLNLPYKFRSSSMTYSYEDDGIFYFSDENYEFYSVASDQFKILNEGDTVEFRYYKLDDSDREICFSENTRIDLKTDGVREGMYFFHPYYGTCVMNKVTESYTEGQASYVVVFETCKPYDMFRRGTITLFKDSRIPVYIEAPISAYSIEYAYTLVEDNKIQTKKDEPKSKLFADCDTLMLEYGYDYDPHDYTDFGDAKDDNVLLIDSETLVPFSISSSEFNKRLKTMIEAGQMIIAVDYYRINDHDICFLNEDRSSTVGEGMYFVHPLYGSCLIKDVKENFLYEITKITYMVCDSKQEHYSLYPAEQLPIAYSKEPIGLEIFFV